MHYISTDSTVAILAQGTSLAVATKQAFLWWSGSDLLIGAKENILNYLEQVGRNATNSATGTRTRVARVRAEYPNQLDYSGDATLSAKP
jgi:hypothetical protein